MRFEKPRFLHIGYPKCASTSLQYEFFGAHPQIYHLGWGCQHTESGWVDEKLAAAMEVDLRMAKSNVYNPQAAEEALYVHFVHAEHTSPYKVIGISWESLCFTLVFDADPLIKAQRLLRLFGPGTKIIVVVRNQLDLIRSMYFEMVRGGLGKSFQDYLEFLRGFDFTGITRDLCYSRIVQIYVDFFGRRNVMVVPFERFAAAQASELHRICDFLGVSRVDGPIGRHNPSSDLRLLERIRRLNSLQPNNFGSGQFSFVDPQKVVTYWKRAGLEVPAIARRAWELREQIHRQAASMADQDVPPIEAEFPPPLKSWFEALYAPSNRELAREWGIDLAAMGYPA
jgi:hypothetical protein